MSTTHAGIAHAAPQVQLTLMTEELLRAVYTGPLGNRLIPDPAQIQHLTPDVLASFVQQQYVAPQIVLAGAGVDHRWVGAYKDSEAR